MSNILCSKYHYDDHIGVNIGFASDSGQIIYIVIASIGIILNGFVLFSYLGKYKDSKKNK